MKETTADRRWLGLAAILAAMIMNILDSTIANVAAPTIREDIGGSYSSVQWIAAAYTLAIGLLLGNVLIRLERLLTGRSSRRTTNAGVSSDREEPARLKPLH